MMSIITVWLIFSLTSFELMNGQSLKIYKYRQKHSLTNCTRGLIKGDTVVFKAEIDYADDPTMNHVHIYIKKRNHRFANSLVYDLQKDCNNEMKDCQHTDAHYVVITIKVHATNEYSLATIYGKLLLSDSTEIVSEIHHFPKIYDTVKIKRRLFFNGVKIRIKRKDQVIKLSGNDVNIVFECTSKVSPCVIQIRANNSDEVVQVNTLALFYKYNNTVQDMHVTIRYGVCSLEKNTNKIELIFRKDENPYTEQTESINHNSKNVYMTTWLLINVLSNIAICGVFFLLQLFVKPYIKPHLFKKKLTEKKLEAINNSNKKNFFKADVIVQPNKVKVSDKTKSLKDYTCDRNPGHTHFYPVNVFTKNHIDEICRDQDLYDLLKTIADLTVSVLVTFKSNDRPKTDKTSDDMSPNFYVSEKNGFRLKTGMIIDVCTVSENIGLCCPCQNCKQPLVKSKKWGKVLILTSCTVVYDNNEAKKSCFNLFYDSHSKETVTVYGSCINEINIDEGWCIVECFTCNLDLLNKLDDLIAKCRVNMSKVNNTWKEHGHKSSFVCIVSHPHDIPKQVTMGYWRDKVVEKKSGGIEYTRYQYSTPTCHGSAGAFVYILGVSDISVKHYHVHLGVRKSGYSYCSTGKKKSMNITDTFNDEVESR